MLPPVGQLFFYSFVGQPFGLAFSLGASTLHNMKPLRALLAGLFMLCVPAVLLAQLPRTSLPSSSQLLHRIQKAQRVGSVLYIAAHPDDENTAMLAYYAQGAKLRTAYISLTRGGGGQNLIGSELGIELDMIRTQELLAARSVDGAEQFFTRARDFGYSKNPEETLSIWDKATVLEDVVWAVRAFRPDIIITRFSPDAEAYPTHGHHTTSAILGLEAFKLAADPNAYPQQLDSLDVWQAKRIFWNSWLRPNQLPNEQIVTQVDVGGYAPLTGKSYGELAGESRTMHKSQGFGYPRLRGERIEQMYLLDGDLPEADPLEDINLSWSRLKGGAAIGRLLSKVEDDFNPQDPSASVPKLLEALALVEQLEDEHWRAYKSQELRGIIRDCLGLWMEATVAQYYATPGDSLPVFLSVTNRGRLPVELLSAHYNLGGIDSTIGQTLHYNATYRQTGQTQLPAQHALSTPHFIQEAPGAAHFSIPNPAMRNVPWQEEPFWVDVQLRVAGQALTYRLPIWHKWNDRIRGDSYRPLAVVPPLSVNFDKTDYMAPNGQAVNVQLRLQAHREGLEGQVSLELPAGWQAQSQAFTFSRAGEQQVLSFTVQPGAHAQPGAITARYTLAGQSTSQQAISLTSVEYEHIPTLTRQEPSQAALHPLQVNCLAQRVAYVMGAGDLVPEGLQQIGVPVMLLPSGKIAETDLSQFGVILLGIRAYNTEPALAANQQRLMDYVQQGGTLVVQYNTVWGLPLEQIGPYPIKLGRSRVTDETAPMHALAPEHPVLNVPNKLTEEDFTGWVQERGLYFAEEWDEQYTAIFEAHDPGEEPAQGSLLIVKYGKGYFVYTGISFFRQLPAGVPGAHRLLANILSLGQPQP